MNINLRRMINEQVFRSLNESAEYYRTRSLVESLVREGLMECLLEKKKRRKKKKSKAKKGDSEKSKKSKNSKSKPMQVRDALNDPAVNKSGLARKIDGLSGNDDARRSEISKIARGEWVPDTTIQNDILQTIAAD